MQISQDDISNKGILTRKLNRRSDFASTEIYLPKVMVINSDKERELDYETDIISNLDWRGFDPKNIAELIPENAQAAEHQLQRIMLAKKGDELLVGETVFKNSETRSFDPSYAVRMISDLVPNPFVGREIVGKLMARLNLRGFDYVKLGMLANLIIEELRKGLDNERTTRAEKLFKSKVIEGNIQFRLRLDSHNWRMPFSIETLEPENARQLVNKTGGPLEKSLFSPVYENDLNNDEQDVAGYLDGEKALSWWHRNVARTQYGIQGWKRAKIYPDFIFAVQGPSVDKRIIVLETKGDHLDNLDTAYKREVLNFLSNYFKWDDFMPAGKLDLVQNSGEIVQCTLVLMSEWKSKLPQYL